MEEEYVKECSINWTKNHWENKCWKYEQYEKTFYVVTYTKTKKKSNTHIETEGFKD